MKRVSLVVVLALAAAAAHAQRTFEPAVPRGIPDARVSPSGELPQPAIAPRTVEPAVPQMVEPAIPRMGDAAAPRTVEPTTPRFRGSGAPQLVMDSRHRRDADARSCLRFTSDIQVHRCAERFRAHRARVTKTVAKPESAVSAQDRARAADLAKPDMSKAAEPAKPVDTTKGGAAPAPAARAPEPAKPAASASASAEPSKPKWTDAAKGAAQGMFTKGAKAADDATK